MFSHILYRLGCIETPLNNPQNRLNIKAIISVEKDNEIIVKKLNNDQSVTTTNSITFIPKKSGHIFIHPDELIEKLVK